MAEAAQLAGRTDGATGAAVCRVILKVRADGCGPCTAYRVAGAAAGRTAAVRAKHPCRADVAATIAVINIGKRIRAGTSTDGLACRTGSGAGSVNAEPPRAANIPAGSAVEGVMVKTGAEGASAAIANRRATAAARLATPARADRARGADGAAGAAVNVVSG